MGGSAGTIARIGLTAVGAVVGGAFGNPAIGALVGSTVGGLLFPQRLPGVSGPRLNDAELTVSTEGAAIPLVYGSHVVAGNIIWAAPLEEVEQTEEQGGKGGGGGQEVTTYTYYLSFALALCEGPVNGIRRIWENGKLIYDARPKFDDETDGEFNKRLAAIGELEEIMTIYLGHEQQEPDPIIESHEGVDNVSAHRGLAYLMFERYDVTAFGGRPPQFKVEITAAPLVFEPVEEWESDKLHPWIEGTNDPRNAANDHTYRREQLGSNNAEDGDDGQGADNVSFSAAMAEAIAIEGYTPSLTPVGWVKGVTGATGGYPRVSPFVEVDPEERVELVLTHNEIADRYIDGVVPTGGASICSILATAGAQFGEKIWFSGRGPEDQDYSEDSIPSVVLLHQNLGGGTYSPPLYGQPKIDGSNNCLAAFGTPSLGSPTPAASRVHDITIVVERVPVGPQPDCSPTAPDWPFLPDEFCWDPETGEISTKAPWVKTGGDYRWLSIYDTDNENLDQQVIRYPLGPVRPWGHPDDIQAFWQAAYAQAVEDGDLPSGMTYNAEGDGDETTYPRNFSYAWYRNYRLPDLEASTDTTVGAIVADQCQRVGLASDEFTVSGLSERIRGYKVERVMPARDIIEPLRSYSFFDCVETDRIRFPLRGASVVASLDDDDLAAHAPGSEPPPLVQIERIEDVELPRIVRVGYANVDAEYLAGQQIRSRQVVDSALVSDFDSTIACDETKAAQMADVLLAQAWMGRESYKIFASPRWLALEPADGINIPVRGEIQRARIDSITQALPGILEIEAVRDGDTAGLYTSSVTGSPSAGGNQVLEPIGETTLAVIDSTALLSAHNDAGVYLAARGEGNRWRGYQLLQSTDGGSNYSGVASFAPPTTMGTLLDALPAGPYEIWDRANTFRVAIDQGTLQTLAEATVLQGNNAAFIGADGRWMLLLFATAELLEVDEDGRSIYRLSNLLQGWQGTEWAIGSSQVGDTFALASTLQRLVLDPGAIGLARLYKAVSFGRPVSLATAQAFTPQGNALRPWAPATIRGARDDSGNLSILGYRRTRLFGAWNDNDSVPLNEETEAYEVDVFSGGSPDVVLRVISASAFPISYTAAQQTADFGSPQTDIRVRVYQLSAVVGRGYPTEAIV